MRQPRRPTARRLTFNQISSARDGRSRVDSARPSTPIITPSPSLAGPLSGLARASMGLTGASLHPTRASLCLTSRGGRRPIAVTVTAVHTCASLLTKPREPVERNRRFCNRSDGVARLWGGRTARRPIAARAAAGRAALSVSRPALAHMMQGSGTVVFTRHCTASHRITRHHTAPRGAHSWRHSAQRFAMLQNRRRTTAAGHSAVWSGVWISGSGAEWGSGERGGEGSRTEAETARKGGADAEKDMDISP